LSILLSSAAVTMPPRSYLPESPLITGLILYNADKWCYIHQAALTTDTSCVNVSQRQAPQNPDAQRQ